MTNEDRKEAERLAEDKYPIGQLIFEGDPFALQQGAYIAGYAAATEKMRAELCVELDRQAALSFALGKNAERVRSAKLIEALRKSLCLTEPHPRKLVAIAIAEYEAGHA